MGDIRCPQCGAPLPWIAKYCPRCGHSVPPQALSAQSVVAANSTSKDTGHQRPGSLKTHSFTTASLIDADETQRLDRSQLYTGKAGAVDLPLVATQLNGHTATGNRSIKVGSEEAHGEEEVRRRAIRQKVVTRKIPAMPVSARQSAPAPGSASEPVPVSPVRPTASVTPVAQASGRPYLLVVAARAHNNKKNKPQRSPSMPRMKGWIALLVLLALLLCGALEVYVSLSRDTGAPPPGPGPLSLQATPASIAPGGMVTLRGSHFSPRTRVGLTRDASIPVIDTGGSSFITTDANGSFSDTVSIDGVWAAGAHTIHAEDALLHRIASTTLLVTGQSPSLRPAHLTLSASSIDFGPGDQATNSTRVMTLSNAGGGEISWQSTTTQPSWLLLSPGSGSLNSDQQMRVTLAIDRSSLQVGPYAADVIFTSNAGQVPLSIKMQVVQLLPGYQAVMQLTPALLSFSGLDGGASPSSQVVTLSNPGVLPLQWSAASDGSNWLAASPQSGTVTKGNGQPVTVSVNSSQLLPGVYYGSVIFSSHQGQGVVNSPQSIYVSVTIVPQCALQVSPGTLAFAAVYLQPAPPAKTIGVGVNQGCTAALNWNATATTSSGVPWLTISARAGSTQATPRVGINVTGLKPGNYSGALIFSSAAGTQTLPVTLVMDQSTTPILTSAPALLTVNAVNGQPQPSIQAITLSNTGGGTLSWNAAAVTTVSGAWLAVTPAAGALLSHQTATITVTVTMLPTLIPGTYSGSITLTGNDGAGLAAAGSPQTLPITVSVQAPCSLSTPLPTLAFQSVVGQPAPAAQQLPIVAGGACANALDWSATAATVPAGGTWLTATPATGVVSVKAPSLTLVGIANAGLVAGTYTGSVTLSATDRVTHLAVGKPVEVKVTLNVQSACTLLAPSVKTETVTSEAGSNPTANTQTLTIGVVGGCTGNVTITPAATMTDGTGWLTVSPAAVSIATSGSATFTVTVASAALAVGTYGGGISLAAVTAAGIAIAGSPQAVSVTLSVLSAPALTAGPASLSFNGTAGVNSQTITINNTGGEPLNWSAALAANAPSYVSISSANRGTLAGAANSTVTISVNATGLAGGTTALTSVSLSAIDPLTGKTVSGSPASVSITVTINSPPAMKLSATAVALTATVGNNPAAQAITITNTGGGMLTWAAGAPVYSPSTAPAWLTVSPSTGSDAAGSVSTPSFSVNDTGMVAGTYKATVDFSAPGGILQTVTVTLTIG